MLWIRGQLGTIVNIAQAITIEHIQKDDFWDVFVIFEDRQVLIARYGSRIDAANYIDWLYSKIIEYTS